MAHGKQTSRVGQAHGSKRGKERQRRRTTVRYSQPRVKDSMADARRAQEALDARIAFEKKNPTVGAAEGAMYSNDWREQDVRTTVSEPTKVGVEGKVVRRTFPVQTIVRMRVPHPEAQGEEWTLHQARSMLRQGYTIHHVMHVTRWGEYWLADVPMDDEGRGTGEIY